MKQKKGLAVCTAALVWFSCMTTLPNRVQAFDYAANKARVSVHDPSIFKDPQSGTYYVFGSHIDAAKSTDLQSWKLFTNGYATGNNKLFGSLSSNLQKPFAWAGENMEDCAGGFAVWAPDVYWNPQYVNKDGSKGAYMMYFCTSSTYKRSVIAFGVSQNAEGPYTCVDTLIYSGFTSGDSYATSSTKNVNRKYTSTNIDELIASGEVTYNEAWFNKGDFNNQLYPNAIDPTIYNGADGKMYMTYGSWSGGIFTLEIDPQTGRCIHPKTGTTADGRMVDSYFGTKICGGYGKSGEGPFIEYNEDTGYYYLWVTYGGLTSNGGYNMRVFRSKSPTGPFVDPANRNAVLASNSNLNDIGLKVMGNHKFSSLQTAYMACGHNSVLKDDNGAWYLFNHTRFDDGAEFHEVRVHAMKFNEAGWPVVMPYEYSGETWSDAGYEIADLAGNYEFINHGLATDGNIIKAVNISLSADGKISGGATGTWKEQDGSAAATFTIGNVNYHGYFQAMHDESKTGKVVMTFTAVGADNKTIWGVQTTNWTGSERNALADYTNPNSQLVYDTDNISVTDGGAYLCGTSLLSDIPYYIENGNSAMVIDLSQGKADEGTLMQQWTKTGGSQQEWRLVDVGGGYCKIVSMVDESMCIAVQTETAEDGAAVELQKYSGKDNQQWKLIPDGGRYAIASKCSQDTACLDVYEWSTENGGVIKQWNYWGGSCQLWSLTPVRPVVTDGAYLLRNPNSGYWVGADDGGLVQDADKSVWTVTAVGDGFFTICNAMGKAVTVANAEDGADLTLAEADGSENQKFAIHACKDGGYVLLSAVSGCTSCFDVYEISKEAGAKVCQWNYWGGEGQEFVFDPAIPVPIETTTTTTTTTTTMTTTETKTALLLGDVDCEGSVNVADVILLSRYVSEDKAAEVSEQGLLNADCNRDELVDANDITLIIECAAHLITLE